MDNPSDEASLMSCIELYKIQLGQVQVSLQACNGESYDDLLQLEADLQQLIQLTEESLLSLKKSRLLSMLEAKTDESHVKSSKSTRVPVSTGSSDGVSGSSNISNEYAAFQAALADDLDNGSTSFDAHTSSGDQKTNPASSSSDSDSSDSDSSDEMVVAETEEDDLSGTKCRAPFSHSWGEMSYHNAMVLCREIDPSADEPQVRVMFCNPAHNSMKPCPYFLDGKCHYDDLHCRFSHGEIVRLSELKPFKEPDYSKVSLGSKCLAKDSDGIWYKATVVDILEDHQFHVQFEANLVLNKLEVQDVVPLDGGHTDGDEIDDSEVTGDHAPAADDDLDNDLELPVYLWRPGQTTEFLGGWEEHTRGIGSKLMAKMGYIVGQGLGRHSDGRAELVPIQLLPQGKSLDKIMELKALAGDRDLFDAMKSQRIRKPPKAMAVTEVKAVITKAKPNVFDFLNVQLSGKKGDGKGRKKVSHTAPRVQYTGLEDLRNKSDKHINIQLVKTQEEVRNANREIQRLKISLARNENSDKVMASQIRQKLSSIQDYIGQLKTSEKYMQEHQLTRRAHNSLAKF